MSAIPTVTVLCPDDGRPMRLADMHDALECRCGLWVGFDAYLDAKEGQPIPREAFHQGEPWKEPKPGIRISDRYSDIAVWWDHSIVVDPAKFADEAALQIACANAFEGTGLRYRGRPQSWSTGLVIDGETLPRQRAYALAPVGQEPDAIRGLVRFIRRKHGTGQLWAAGRIPIVPLKRRTDEGYRGAEVGGVLHVVLGCYYFHKPDATSATLPPQEDHMPKRTEECQQQINTARQMPANWQSGTDADRRRGDTQQVMDAERPAPEHPGAPAKLPGYGKERG